MALISRANVLCALLVLVCGAAFVYAETPDEEGIIVETVVEEELYQSPTVDPKKVYLAEHFDDEAAFNRRWVRSEAKKQGVDEDLAKYDGAWEIQEPIKKLLKNDKGLVLTTEAKHAAISTLLSRPFEFTGKPLVVQYEVTMQEGQNCGGAYIKLLSRGVNTRNDLKQFHDQTPYTIMFGPDKCGNDHKLHFIFRHVNPKNGTIEEKHCKKPSERLDDIYKDKEPHLYTLIIRPDNTFSIQIDNKEVNAGSLLEHFTPPVNPPEEIDDPEDKKPEDWDEREKFKDKYKKEANGDSETEATAPSDDLKEYDGEKKNSDEVLDRREKIVDPSAVKPEDWDETAPAQIPDPNAVKPDGWLDNEPETIPDPDAVKPSDWDEDMDGSWEAPLIDNPACAAAPGCGPWSPPLVANPEYKGPWRAPLVSNPNYRGKWSPRRVPNPHYFKDEHPYRMTPITAIGFELWSMSPRLLFDNLVVTDDERVAAAWADKTTALKRARIAKDADSVMERALKFATANPWVYVVAILVVFLVVGFVIFLCTGSSKVRAGDEDPDADRKKTDAFAEDDQISEGEGERGEELPEEEERGEEAPRRGGKAQLEGEQAVSTDDTAPLVDADGSGDHQRRRKPRRE